ncbi:GNAT family N-acetyltransferase [Brevundimonas sp.]|uniref:GNAT family N-acetyltransferase n=1 Tax=Brevundimonas sp. TaxID=1871086 RepID=UPI002FC66464
MRGSGAGFLLARDASGAALGCGGYRPLEPGVAEIKRMYAAPGTRGVGAALLAALEDRARADGYAEIRLETRRVNGRAVAFYDRSGYARIAPYGRYVGRADAVCFGKPLRQG